MNAEIEKEKNEILGEWERKAIDDLESAELILKESDNYEISIYHSHQAIEKSLKSKLLKMGRNFKFTHDIDVLFEQVYGMGMDKKMANKIAALNALYPSLRYPFGDKMTKDQAEDCLKTAKEMLRTLGITEK